MIRKSIIVSLILLSIGTGILWAASLAVVGGVFQKGGGDTGFSYGPTFPNEGLFWAVTRGQIIIIPRSEWDYDRQVQTLGEIWDWVALQHVFDPRDSSHRRGIMIPLELVCPLAALYPAIALWVAPMLRRRRDESRERRMGSCANCGYCLMGNESGVCPECGVQVRAPD